MALWLRSLVEQLGGSEAPSGLEAGLEQQFCRKAGKASPKPADSNEKLKISIDIHMDICFVCVCPSICVVFVCFKK